MDRKMKAGFAALFFNFWDYSLVFLVIAILALGGKALDLTLVALLVPLVLQIFSAGKAAFPAFGRSDMVFVILVFQYLIWHALVAQAYPLSNDPIPVRLVETPQFWLIMVALMCLATWRFAAMNRLETIWRYTAPAGLIFVFLFLSVDYFTAFRGTACRISGYAFNPNVPPVFFTIFTIGSFLGWAGFSSNQRLLRYALVVFAVIIATAYAGSRMLMLVQVISFGLLSLTLPATGSKGRLQIMLVLGMSGAAGIVVGLSFDALMGCDFLQRLGLLSETITQRNPEAGGISVNGRFEVIQKTLALIASSPWTGFGISLEKQISVPLYHAHNQYLSWMIWGGIVSLVSGLGFLVSASLVPVLRLKRDGVILALAVPGVVALNSLTDSLLYHDIFNYHYGLVLALFFGLGRSMLLRSENATGYTDAGQVAGT